MNADLETAIAALEARASASRPPTRHEARAILLALGQALAEGRDAAVEVAAGRLAKLPEPFHPGWHAAVREELAMAVTEYVRSVDPRYLAHPEYDLAYTLDARRRLELRLRAAERLGLPADRPTAESVARADVLLERHTRTPFRESLEQGGGETVF